MQTLKELGEAVAARRKQLGLKQGDVAAMAGMTAESLSRFERGRSAEFGTRKLLAVNAVKRLQAARARLVGVLINKFQSKHAAYGYGYGAGYGSYSYYSYGASDSKKLTR